MIYNVCKHCGKIFEFDKRTGFCSGKCKNEFHLIRKENFDKIENARFTIFNRDDFKCVYCGSSSIEDSVKLCIDHIDPYKLTKNNNIYNLITSCISCNLSKGVMKLPKEIYERIISRNRERTNKRISNDSKTFINEIMDIYFGQQKEKCHLKLL